MKDIKHSLFLILIGVLFFIPFLGNVHLFDWDEVNFAEISREMIMTGDYLKVQINYQPFFEKPPMFFWLQVLSMKVFGINEFAARFPNTLVGIITLLVLFRIGTLLYNRQFGIIWALAYFGSILPHLYFRSGIIDPLFNLFIFLGFYFFLKFKWIKDGLVRSGKQSQLFASITLSGIFIGLALLTKGPVAYLILILSFAVYWIKVKFRLFVSVPWFIWISFVAFTVMFTWFGLEMLQNGPAFIREFIVYQIRLFTTHDAGHSGFPGFHFIVLLIGCFPASIFAIRGFYRMPSGNKIQQDFRVWMIILFWVVLVLFSIVQSKIVHYSSLAYFPLTFLAAITISGIIDRKISFSRPMRTGIIVLAFIIALPVIATPFIGRNIDLIRPLLKKDPNGVASLNAEVNWTGWEAMAGVLIIAVIMLFFYLVRRREIRNAFYSLFTGIALFVFTALVFLVGRIEMYSQNAHVEFAKSLAGKNCYVTTSGFKSYVHLFYPQIKPGGNPERNNIAWLVYEPVDREVYIISRSHLREYWSGVPEVEILYEKNSFLFIKRKAD